MTDSKFQIGLVQMQCSPDPGENLAKAEGRVLEAAGRGAQIVCLPELIPVSPHQLAALLDGDRTNTSFQHCLWDLTLRDSGGGAR